jgi:hypothetical protein
MRPFGLSCLRCLLCCRTYAILMHIKTELHDSGTLDSAAALSDESPTVERSSRSTSLLVLCECKLHCGVCY